MGPTTFSLRPSIPFSQKKTSCSVFLRFLLSLRPLKGGDVTYLLILEEPIPAGLVEAFSTHSAPQWHIPLPSGESRPLDLNLDELPLLPRKMESTGHNIPWPAVHTEQKTLAYSHLRN